MRINSKFPVCTTVDLLLSTAVDTGVWLKDRLVLGGAPETALRRSRAEVLAWLPFCIPCLGRRFGIGRKRLHRVPALRGGSLTWLCFTLEDIGAVSHLRDGFEDLTTPKLPTPPEMPVRLQPLPPGASRGKPGLASDPEGWGARHALSCSLGSVHANGP